ncbi:XisI protein [Synechococcus sp. PCC 7502]|uniref:XisI protein n=1 Tax=Synechococcus sp. PCC 7502 TaxID=1173263 RepID=UPI00029FF573|nr:XisI protein [Synechococcus sp. PCC 7502]AFY74778.1 XisI protein [Synechococcus sp. PCC 7502]
MDKLATYRQIICNVLNRYIDVNYANVNAKNKAAFDPKTDEYIVISVGWDKNHRCVHGCLIHIEIIDGLVWVQRDGTESIVTNELVEAGIPKSDIVLGFQEPSFRQYTGYAVA